MTESHFNIGRARKLDNEERIRELKPKQLLEDVGGVAEGMTCIDMGSGTGTFSFPLIQCVGNSGIVYAVDDSAKMLDYIRAKNPPINMRLVHANASCTGLDSGIADLCLLAFVLHEVKEPSILVAEACRLLKPKCKALVVEWKAHLDSPGPPRSRRLTKEHLEILFKQVGLSDFRCIEWSGNHYVAVGNKIIFE